MASTLALPDSRVLSYALDAAPHNGPVVLLANPLLAPYRFWDQVARTLNEEGYRTLRYDQPGHGNSSAPKKLDTTFDSIAEDIHALLKHLGIPKLHSWVGVSMGASTGIVFATKYPNMVNKLAICDTISCSPVNAGIEDAFAPRVAAAREASSLKGAIDSTLERWFGERWLDTNREEAQRMRMHMSGTSLDGYESCINALRSESFDLRPLYAKVGASVDDAVCVVGENDANLPETMAQMRDEIEEGFKTSGNEKSIDLVLIEDAGHVCFVDGYQQFIQFVTGWLKRA